MSRDAGASFVVDKSVVIRARDGTRPVEGTGRAGAWQRARTGIRLILLTRLR
jgi:hypothetical protein